MAQVARPISDTNTGWNVVGAPARYDAIDEPVASNAEYITTPNPATGQLQVVKLGTIQNPGVDTGHTMHWRSGKNASGGNNATLAVSLWQGNPLAGGTVIWSSGAIVQGAGFVLTSTTLPEANVANITDYSNLYVQFSGTGGENVVIPANNRAVQVSWLAFETPDAPPVLKTSSVSGGGTVVNTVTKSIGKTTVVTSGATLTAGVVKAVNRTTSVTGKGTVSNLNYKAVTTGSTVTGKGVVDNSSTKGSNVASSSSAGGRVVTSVSVVQEEFIASVVSGKGTITTTVQKNYSLSSSVSGKEVVGTVAIKDARASSIVSSGAVVTNLATKSSTKLSSIAAGSVLTNSVTKSTTYVSNVTGGGVVSVTYTARREQGPTLPGTITIVPAGTVAVLHAGHKEVRPIGSN